MARTTFESKKVCVSFTKNDADIYRYLQKQRHKSELIKDLLREHMEKERGIENEKSQNNIQNLRR